MCLWWFEEVTKELRLTAARNGGMLVLVSAPKNAVITADGLC